MSAKKNIRSDFTRIVALMLIVVIGILSAVSIYYIQDTATDSLTKSMSEISLLAADKITNEVDNLKSVATSVGYYASRSDATLLSIRNYTTSMSVNNGYDKIDVVNSTLASIVSSDKYTEDSIAGRALDKDAILSGPIVENDTVHFEFAYPYEGRVIVIYIPYSLFGDIVSAINIGETGSTYILDNTGAKVVHNDISLVAKRQNNLEDVKADPATYGEVAALETEMVNGQSGFGFYKWKGDKKFGSYAPIAGTDGWSINVTALESEFMSGVTSSLLIILIIGVISLFAAIIIVRHRAKRIVNPIEEMVTNIDQVYQGNLNVEFVVHRNDEIGLISEKLNGMVTTYRTLIADISHILNEIANENLTVETTAAYPGDFNQIKLSLAQIITGLNDIMNQFTTASSEVRSGAEQLSAGAQNLSQSVTEQAGTLEELAATIETISVQVKNAAEQADIGNKKMNNVSHELQTSNEKMQEMTVAMNLINSTSAEIQKIIKTIEDIAFQTNILALNAAVEAARAGAAGKGFAVVADEVRNLSSKSAEAAKNTTTLIEKSLEAVQNGTQIADDTAASLSSTVLLANDVSKVVHEITLAAKEESASIEQVNIGITQVASVVQTNSATAEESAASSEELLSHANLLENRLSSFKLKNDESSVLEAPILPAEETLSPSEDFETPYDKY